MDATGWIVLGLIAGFFGCVTLEEARTGRHGRPVALFVAVLAGFGAYENFGWLWEQGGRERLAACGLLWGAVSPLVGWLLWGRDGANLRMLLRLVVFCLTAISAALVWPQIAPGIDVWTWSLSTGALTLLPYRAIRRYFARLRSARQHQRELREQRQIEVAQAEAGRRQEEEDEEVLRGLVEQLRRRA